MKARTLRILMVVTLLSMTPGGQARADGLSSTLVQALAAVRSGKATEAQRALLFQNNARINQARLNGWITDGHYQAAQNDFAKLNQDLARRAAIDAGADFSVQKSTSNRFSPGTDSDFIVTVKSKQPVAQIADMQTRYNRHVNDYLKEALGSENLHFNSRSDWHNRLDVDFMADPRFVTEAQFQEIAELNNDAYRRRQAAEYERISRSSDGAKVGADQFRDYALEMREFVEKKRRKMEKYRRHPELLTDPTEMAEHQRLMAQEQKYIERVESANDRLRRQEGLGGMRPGMKEPVYELTFDARGNARIRKRSSGSIAARGAVRSPTNRGTTIAAGGVSENSANRAFRQLAESMADAHAKNPGAWAKVADDIAQIAETLPPADKGLLIERITRRGGKKLAGEVAEAMRRRAKPHVPTSQFQRLDNALQSALGVSSDVAEMGNLRRGLNDAAGRALGGLDKVGKLGTALDLAFIAADAHSYWENLRSALDPNITDEEADRYFQRAQEASQNVALAGGAGVLFEAVPTLGAAYAGWTLGYDGTRWILTNTETGRAIDRHVTDYFDRHTQAFERSVDKLNEYFGGESQHIRDRDRALDLQARYLRAIREGRIKLRPGVASIDVLRRLRDGDVWGLEELMEPNVSLGPAEAASSMYMAWRNDVGWIHVGTVEQFRSPRARGSEIWGGRSRDPLVKTSILGGHPFAMKDDAMAALAAELGGKVKRKRAPLAFPKIYYAAGDSKVGFEIINHASFRDIKAAADAGG